MTVKEAMLYFKEKNIDVDFLDDYDERTWMAYCGTNWSKKAEEKYSVAFNLELEDELPFEDMPQTLVVHCNNAKEAKALNDLLLSMAGYIEADDDYDELYPDESDKLEINNNLLYDIMSRHAGHNVSITNYGAGANMTLECNDCNCVLFDTDVYDLIGVV